MPEPVRRELEAMLKRAQSPKAGLCVAIFEADPKREAGRPVWDWLIVTGYIVAVLQIVIAAIPWIVWGEWEIFAITVCGTVLAFSTASLPQWRSERYACRRNSTGTVVLTRGNGAQHAIVIQGNGCGLNLEDLAGATEGGSKSLITRTAIAVLSCLWVGLLITVSGIKEKTWFAVAVGAIGMLFSIVVAGAPRKPEAFGVPLVYKAVCVENRTMETLKKVEGLYPGVGRSMTATFFPGGLRDADAKWWAKSKKAAKAAEREKRSEMRWRLNGDAVPKQRNLSVDGRKRGSDPNGSTNDQSLLENATHKTELANNEYL